eukprot:gene24919-33412_t
MLARYLERRQAQKRDENVINELDRFTLHEQSAASALGECSISHEPYELGDVVVTLPCRHQFKDAHIVQWLRTQQQQRAVNLTCPICRAEVAKCEQLNPLSV